MQTLYTGFIEDAEEPIFTSLGIRIAYLLSSRFRLAGDLQLYFGMEEGFRNFSFDLKLKFIEEHDPGRPAGFIEEQRRYLKILKREKRPKKELIVLIKQNERAINNYFDLLLKEFIKPINRTGIPQLKDLLNQSSFGMYNIPHAEPESEDEDFSKLSEALQLNLAEEDMDVPTLPVLNYLFFTPEFASMAAIEIPVLGEWHNGGFIHELFTLQHFGLFTVSDMEAIRSNIKHSLQLFHQEVNQFLEMGDSPQQAFEYLKHIVQSTATDLSNAIHNAELIANYRESIYKNVPPVKVLMGMLPRKIVYKYFEFTKAAGTDTFDIINRLKDGDRLLPVILFSLPVPSVDPGIINTGVETLPIKKSLSID